MTRFEELQAIINKNKNKSCKLNSKISQLDSKEISGLTDSGKGQPRIEFVDDETDMPLTDQLYRNPKHRPNDGSGASYWDQ